jgi:hypothetical protein
MAYVPAALRCKVVSLAAIDSTLDAESKVSAPEPLARVTAAAPVMFVPTLVRLPPVDMRKPVEFKEKVSALPVSPRTIVSGSVSVPKFRSPFRVTVSWVLVSESPIVIVSPAAPSAKLTLPLAVNSSATVAAPWIVVVTPDLLIDTALAWPVPIDTVPFVLLAVPASMLMFPDVPLVAAPLAIVTSPVLPLEVELPERSVMADEVPVPSAV